ncbi:MAG: TIGR02281 family clan AA aspartic protease [Sphingomonadaceae bacterium]|nr:TIGR02281 family clan AA aspartic protease [Sphingomonadaceae bacterium]
MADMWDQAAELIRAIPRGLLLVATVSALVLGWLGSRMRSKGAPLGTAIGRMSTIALVAILATVVLQLSHIDPRMNLAFSDMDIPEQVVSGGETRVKMAPDGHFWLLANVNGKEAPFLVDTGATLTAVSAELAEELDLERRDGGMPIQLNTANGTAAAYLTRLDSLRAGNVSATGLDAVIVTNIGDTNVIGMNLLSQLASWRVEGDTLILVPKQGGQQ